MKRLNTCGMLYHFDKVIPTQGHMNHFCSNCDYKNQDCNKCTDGKCNWKIKPY